LPELGWHSQWSQSQCTRDLKVLWTTAVNKLAMINKSAGRTASLLALVVLAAILWYGHSPHVMDAGVLYLLAAACVDLYCIPAALALRTRLRKGDSTQALWSLERTVRALVLVAWQLAILGLLSIWAVEPVGSPAVLASSGLPLVICIIVSDRLIALADTPSQDGGTKPLSFFGRLRTRRVYFWACTVYPASAPVMLGVRMFMRGKPYPSPLHPPQLCLLLAAVMSVGTAGLVFQRYRGLASDKRRSALCALAVFLVVGFAGVFAFFLAYSRYVYALSSLSVMCVALSAQLVLRASEPLHSTELNGPSS
jgi:hypothetical protein